MSTLEIIRRLATLSGRPVRWVWRTRPKIVLVLFYLLLSVVLFRGVLFKPGTIGLRNDWSIPTFSIQYQARMEQALVNWSQDYLGTPLVRRTDLLLTTVLWFFAKVFKFGGPVFSKAIPLLAFTGAGFFSYVLLAHIDRGRLGAFTGSLLYMLSPLMFNLVVFGQHHFMIGYALYPLVTWLFLRTMAARQPWPWLLMTGVTFAFALSQDTFATIIGATLCVIILGATIATGKTGLIRRLARNSGFLIGVVVIGLLLHAPTLLSVLAHRSALTATLQLVSVAWNTWLSPETLDALSLEGAGIRSFLDAVTLTHKAWWMLTNSAVIMVVFSAVLLPRKRRLMLVLAGLGLATVFIFKGVHAPLGFINKLIFAYVPGMLVFRNLQYITVFSNLIFAILLTHVVNYWHEKRVWRMAYVAFLIILALRAGPFFSGTFHRGIQVYNLSPAYEEVYSRLYHDPEDYRVLWLPPVQPMTYKDSPHAGLDPFGSQSPKPSLIDNPTQPMHWLLNMVMYTRPETDLGELLRRLAVRYVIYRDDLVSRTPQFQWGEFPKDEWTNEQLKRWLANQSALVPDASYGGEAVKVLRHTSSRARLVATGSAALSTGDLSDYVWLADYWPTTPYSARDTLFAPQINPAAAQILPAMVDRATIVNNNYFDLEALFLGDEAQELRIMELTRDTKDGWSLNWPWKDWRYASILEPAVFTVKSYETTVPFSSPAMTNASLWVKAYVSSKGGSLRWSLDGRPLKSIDLVTDALQGWQWYQLPVGEVAAGEHRLAIRTGEGEHVIGRMLLTPGDVVAEAKRTVDHFLASRELYLSLNLDFRDAPRFTSVPPRAVRSDTLFSDLDVPLEVPLGGVYDVALHASGGSYVSQEQREGDSYQTIERGKTVGQTFTVALTDTQIERLQFSAEARVLKTNIPAPVMPDAPLTARLYRMKNGEQVLVGESQVKPSAAGINDAWKLVDADFSVTVERDKDPFPLYRIDLSTEATNVVWAVRTVQQGFRGQADYYASGELLVIDKPQPADLAFTVVARSDDAKLDVIAIDGTSLPSADFTHPWQNRATLELTPGTHTVSLRGVRSHTAHVQLMIRRQGSADHPLDPPLTITDHGITSFTTNLVPASTPYLLVFAESYDPRWQVVVKTDDEKSSLVPEVAHVKVNGFSNGWWISADHPHSIRVQYAPQRAYRAGLFIAAITALVVAGLLVGRGIYWLRQRYV